MERVRGASDLTLAVSGFHDKSGDPLQNQELAKRRALAVHALLVAAGIDEGRVQLKAPAEASVGSDDREARRVDVSVSR